MLQMRSVKMLSDFVAREFEAPVVATALWAVCA
jgi:hypothetical protein